MSRNRKTVMKPKDIRQWWLSACCGDLSLDITDICGFCGETRRKCAEDCSEAVNANLIVTGNGDIEGRAELCGGSGFWCKGCGRFWAQDTCGNHDEEFHISCDDQELSIKDGFVHCCCGHKLMKSTVEED